MKNPFEALGRAFRTAKFGLITLIILQASTIVVLVAQGEYIVNNIEPVDEYEIASAVDLSLLEADVAAAKREASYAADAAERAANGVNTLRAYGCR